MKCKKRMTLLFLGMGVLCVVSAYGMEDNGDDLAGSPPKLQRKNSSNVVETFPVEKASDPTRHKSKNDLELFGAADVPVLKQVPTLQQPVIAMVVKPLSTSPGYTPRKMLEGGTCLLCVYALYLLYYW